MSVQKANGAMSAFAASATGSRYPAMLRCCLTRPHSPTHLSA